MSGDEARQELVAVLLRVEELLRLPDCDVNWPVWNNPDQAIRAERDRIERGEDARLWDAELLFAPTSEIGEVAASSGWGAEYIALADRADAAIEASNPAAKQDNPVASNQGERYREECRGGGRRGLH